MGMTEKQLMIRGRIYKLAGALEELAEDLSSLAWDVQCEFEEKERAEIAAELKRVDDAQRKFVRGAK